MHLSLQHFHFQFLHIFIPSQFSLFLVACRKMSHCHFLDLARHHKCLRNFSLYISFSCVEARALSFLESIFNFLHGGLWPQVVSFVHNQQGRKCRHQHVKHLCHLHPFDLLEIRFQINCNESRINREAMSTRIHSRNQNHHCFYQHVELNSQRSWNLHKQINGLEGPRWNQGFLPLHKGCMHYVYISIHFGWCLREWWYPQKPWEGTAVTSCIMVTQ